MNKHFEEIILEATEATDLIEKENIQDLWSGYGKILRFDLIGSKRKSVVVKDVRLPMGSTHPRGWNTNLSHQRKLHSYQVETIWYEQYSHLCDEACYVPRCLAIDNPGDEVLIILEDLNESGFSQRKSVVNRDEIEACIAWLANFHATFLGMEPKGLWETGTYWHLATRPEELKALSDTSLKKAAEAIDKKLSMSPFQTFVHGDAKLANFCFTPEGNKVAAVDFQYVGGGCGMKDLAYFVGSGLYEDQCEEMEASILDFYFKELHSALIKKGKDLDFDALEADWRALYPVAWADFHRFLKGWSPGHWKINSYSERLSREVIAQLEGPLES